MQVVNQAVNVFGCRNVGKTAFGLNLAYNALLNTPDITIEVFSLEMSNEQNLKRIYAIISLNICS